MMDNVILADEKFRGSDFEYIVTINVTPTFKLFWVLIKAVYTKTDVAYTHTFTNNPFEAND